MTIFEWAKDSFWDPKKQRDDDDDDDDDDYQLRRHFKEREARILESIMTLWFRERSGSWKVMFLRAGAQG